MANRGMYSSYGVAAPPFTKGPYTWDQNLTLTGNLTVNGTFTFGDAATDDFTCNGFLKLNAADGADSANGLLMGVGTSGDPATTSTAGKSFMEFRTQSTATSGDSRGFYLRHELGGAGVSGEAIRAFSKLTAATSTSRGAHISLDIASGGSVTGAGYGVDGQILVPDAAVGSGGTYAVLNAEIYSAGSSSDMGAVTELSYMRINNGGDATGAGTIDDDAFLFVLNGFTSGAAHLWYDNQKAAPAVEEFVKVKTPSGTRYLALYNANA